MNKLNNFKIELLNAIEDLNSKRIRGELSRDEYFMAIKIKRAEIIARHRQEKKAMRVLTSAYLSKCEEIAEVVE